MLEVTGLLAVESGATLPASIGTDVVVTGTLAVSESSPHAAAPTTKPTERTQSATRMLRM